MGFKIDTLTAFISVDPRDGAEGLIGLPLPGSALSMPAIAADGVRAQQLYPLVKQYCQNLRVEFRVIRLGTRTDVTEEFDKLYG